MIFARPDVQISGPYYTDRRQRGEYSLTTPLGWTVSDDIKRAWDIVSHARMEVGRGLGEPISGQEKEIRLEGIVHAPGSFSAEAGPRVASIESPDGAEWVIDYDEQSPYHAFVGRQVVALGFSCEPPAQHVIMVSGHVAVSTMRLVEMTPDAWITEVGGARSLSGRFEGDTSDARESPLTFVTQQGETFLVANNPAGATADCSIDARVYPVQPSPSVSDSHQQWLWVICPWSYADLWELRRRPHAGLPRGVYVDAESRQIRRQSTSAK
jgi:hypothetical protein